MSVYRVEGDLGSDSKIVIAHEVPFENSLFGLNQDEYIHKDVEPSNAVIDQTRHQETRQLKVY